MAEKHHGVGVRHVEGRYYRGDLFEKARREGDKEVEEVRRGSRRKLSPLVHMFPPGWQRVHRELRELEQCFYERKEACGPFGLSER